ncbi:MAG: phosphate uptake regulator PhoU [Euryarchaeota archaeon]|nr:phosphate uptake regulator PhoU [Euryarchaeota archaeon]
MTDKTEGDGRTAPDAGREMERRKVQLSGRTTYVVSLPKRWVDAANIEPGDVVGVDVQDDGTLLIVPESVKRRRLRECVLQLDDLGPTETLRELMAAYLAGYDRIVMRSRGPLLAEQLGSARAMTRRTVGLEIVEEKKDEVILQDLADPGQFATRAGLYRLHNIVVGMLNDALTALRTGDRELALDVVLRDDSVDRMFLMLSKQHMHRLSDLSVVRKRRVSVKESFFLVQAARTLERCADHAVRVAEALTETREEGLVLPEAAWERVGALGKEAIGLLGTAVDSFLKGDRRMAHGVVAVSERLTRERAELERALLVTDTEALLGLGLVVESLERVHQYAADLAEFAISYALVTGDDGGSRA